MIRMIWQFYTFETTATWKIERGASKCFTDITFKMGNESTEKKEERFVVHYKLSFKHVCLLTVSCPFLALIVCFITAYIYQGNDIHETHCRVSSDIKLLLPTDYMQQHQFFCTLVSHFLHFYVAGNIFPF